jgi:ATP-binding protein involved in chromosome partitioning
LRAQIKKDVETRIAAHPGVRTVTIEWGEMTADERSEVMLKARWAARELAPDTQVPASTRVLAIASGKGGVGKSSVTVNLAPAIAAAGYTVGVLDADIWGFSVPRMLGLDERLEAQVVEGSDRPLIIPHERAVGRGWLKVVSTGLLVDDEGTALMWRGLMLTKAVEQFLRDVHWGPLDYLLIDMPPGTGDIQMGLARMLPQAEMLVVTTPALAVQKVAVRVADMARRSYMKVTGVSGSSYAGYYIHNLHFIAYARQMQGRMPEAIHSAESMAEAIAPLMQEMPMMVDAFASAPLFALLRFHRCAFQ